MYTFNRQTLSCTSVIDNGNAPLDRQGSIGCADLHDVTVRWAEEELVEILAQLPRHLFDVAEVNNIPVVLHALCFEAHSNGIVVAVQSEEHGDR